MIHLLCDISTKQLSNIILNKNSQDNTIECDTIKYDSPLHIAPHKA